MPVERIAASKFFQKSSVIVVQRRINGMVKNFYFSELREEAFGKNVSVQIRRAENSISRLGFFGAQMFYRQFFVNIKRERRDIQQPMRPSDQKHLAFELKKTSFEIIPRFGNRIDIFFLFLIRIFETRIGGHKMSEYTDKFFC